MRKVHGYDVVAAPYVNGGNHYLNRHPEEAWENISEKIMTASSKDDIINKGFGKRNI